MSQRENAIGALFAVLGQLSLGTMVKRNTALPERIADHAMAILRDGEMGEPEVSLSPLNYHWQHTEALGKRRNWRHCATRLSQRTPREA